jgi:hypothetical protein
MSGHKGEIGKEVIFSRAAEAVLGASSWCR